VGTNGCFSDWQSVTNGVPQESMLGPQLFIIYMDDLELVTDCAVSKFAHDTKISGAKDSESLQIV